MPEAMERALRAEAKKKGLTGERADAYVYGTMRKTGWVPSTQKKRKRKAKHGNAAKGMLAMMKKKGHGR